MAEFPTYEEMAKNVAEKALDDFLYNGKSIREWMQIISSEDCISRADLINLLIPKIKTRRSTIEIKHKLIPLIKSLKPIQPKEIYNKGWKDGAEATAYHVELCEEENPTIPLSVIEDIKAEIEEESRFCPLTEGLECALEIIDKHISGKESEGKK